MADRGGRGLVINQEGTAREKEKISAVTLACMSLQVSLLGDAGVFDRRIISFSLLN